MNFFRKSRLFLNAKGGNHVKDAFQLPRGCFASSLVIKNNEHGEKVKYVPVGVFPLHPDGAHELTREKLEEMVANLESDIMVDLGHEGLFNASAPAYGWIDSESFEVRDDGLYGNYPELTPDAEELVRNRKYRFLSPAYELESRDKTGRDLGAKLWPISLTNTPYFNKEIDALRNSDIKPKEDDKMDYTKEFKAKLGLKEDATDEEVEAKMDEGVAALNEIANQKSEAEKATAEKEALEKEAAEKEAAEKEGTEAVANSAVEKRLAALEEKEKAAEKGAAEVLVNSAIADGKILPADKEVWLNSALTDYEGTRKSLEGRKTNSAMPGKTETQEKEKNQPNGGPLLNSLLHDATEHFKAQGRTPGAQAEQS